MVLRAPAHIADLGMCFSSRQETYRLTSVGGSGLFILPTNPGHTSATLYLNLRPQGELLPTSQSNPDAAG